MLMLSSGLNAASITYSLTTHVDGRTITGTANLSDGASLLDNMPQALWRAYTTYTFYSDEALTQPIESVQESVSTVYVDYYFDPPFILSDETNVRWHHFSMYNTGGSRRYWLYYKGYAHQADLLADFNMKNNSSVTSMTTGTNRPENQNWAFYGDGYNLKIKFNDVKNDTKGRNWLVCPQTNSNTANIQKPTSEPTIGWQVYGNEIGSGYCTLGSPYNSAYVLDLSNVSYYPRIIKLGTGDAKDFYLDSHNTLRTSYSSSRSDLWWHAIFATPVGGGPTERWHTTYKIQLVDGTWYPDIVVAKRTGDANTMKISFPSYTKFPRQGETNIYGYDYFYKDVLFTTKYEDLTLTNTQNDIVYIREFRYKTTPFIKDRWITLVVPYDVPRFDYEFGESDAVKVLELYDYELDGNKYDLKFQTVSEMKAHTPYLFKIEKIEEGRELVLSKEINGSVPADSDVEPMRTLVTGAGADVTMIGTYDGITLTYDVEENKNKVYAFLAYNKNDELNFYRITEKRNSFDITPHRCYFTFTDPSGAGKLQILNLSLTEDGATAISQVERDEEQSMSGTYDLMGRKVDEKNMRRGIYVINGRKVVK